MRPFSCLAFAVLTIFAAAAPATRTAETATASGAGTTVPTATLEDQVAAAEYALSVTLADRGSARNLPAVPPARAAQSLMVWRRRG